MTQQFAIGIGCSSNASYDDVLKLIESSGISVTFDALIGTLDRCSVVGRQVADALGLRLMLFPASLLAGITGIEHCSAVALRNVGTHSVAEASALACLGWEGRLVMPRKTGRFCTCAVAVRP